MHQAVIRPEQPGDELATTEVTELAFRTSRHGIQNEHRIILALREANALAVSLVADHAGRIVGHLAFSPVRISDGTTGWYGLGPVSVVPEMQGHGLGTALIRKGLTTLSDVNAQGCVVLGNPAFYGRFGFRRRSDCTLAGTDPEYFQSLTIGKRPAHGEVTYHDAFYVLR